jgi:hypothetical protein
MNAWAASFENWGDCDTVSFHLFDRTPFAWEKVRQWSASPRPFVKRGAFALMACLALHDKAAHDKSFLALLPLIEKGARDERNFVKKGVNWALRAIGRRNAALNAALVTVARRLADSPQAAERWVGKDTLRELTSPAVMRQRNAQKKKFERSKRERKTPMTNNGTLQLDVQSRSWCSRCHNAGAGSKLYEMQLRARALA